MEASVDVCVREREVEGRVDHFPNRLRKCRELAHFRGRYREQRANV